MMRWLVGTSLRFRFIVIAVAAAMVFFGVGRLRQMPVDVFPEFAPPMVEIQTPCLGLTPEEVEDLVTIPLEEALAGVDGLDVMRSKSVPQLSAVKLIFKPGTDLLRARQVVQERVDMVTPSIPTWASPPVMVPPLSATSRTMKIGISSQEHSVIDLSMIAYWKIRQKLLDVEGVANIAIWGERLQMLQVQVDPARLKENGVTLNEVMKTTADALDSGLLPWSDGAVVGTGGFIDTPNQRLHIRHILPILSPEDLAELPVKETDGKVLRLGDVTEVLEDHQPMIGDGIINDEVGLLLIVEKFPWANTLDVSLGVEEALAELKPGLPGIEIDHEIFRPATFIELSIDNLTTALLIGCVLVILILGAFLWEWRVALISIVAIPLSLIAAGVVLYWQGATINTMVLAGFVIALGAVVDDAIIGIENIMRRLRQHRATGSAYSAGRIVLDATIEVRSAIVYATLIEVAALIPVFFMEGLSGAFFKPLAWAYVLAIFASMVVALTVTPALVFILLGDAPLERRESPLIKPLQAGYGRVMSGILKTPVIAYSTLGVMFLAGILIAPQLGQSLLPSFKERDFLMHWLTKPGTSWPEMNRITIQSSKELREIPGVRNFGAHIGQALIMDEVVGIYFGENWISVDPSVDYDETLAHEAITVRIFGHDLHVLREQVEAVEAALKGTPGLPVWKSATSSAAARPTTCRCGAFPRCATV